MRETWDRLEAWLQTHTPWIYEELAPSATEAQLRAAEEAMGCTLPADFRDSYRIHDGTVPFHIWMKGRGAYYGMRPSGFLYDAEDFKDLASVVRVWSELSRSRFPIVPGVLCNVQGPVKQEGSYRTKIPLAGAANVMYYLDLDPAPGGLVGQVIRYTADDVRAVYVAPSYGEWLATMARLLEEGVYVYCPREKMILPAVEAAESVGD